MTKAPLFSVSNLIALAAPLHPTRCLSSQPLQPDMILRRHIRPTLRRIGVTKRTGWQSFRHGLGTMLRQQGVELKTAQELLRRVNRRITIEIYQQTVGEKKRVTKYLAFRGILGAC